jgi:RND family efflux transporter MFP subunit
MTRFLFALILLVAASPLIGPATSGEAEVSTAAKPELKAVYGQVQSRTLSLARARIGGTVTNLKVTEGSQVKSGDELATVVDDKLALQLEAIDSRLKGFESEMNNAAVELNRAKKLLASGVISKTRADALQTQFDVLSNQFKALQSDRAVIVQQSAEGRVLAPASGRVLAVPVTQGSVVMPGEALARIASDGFFIRLSLPERHAAHLNEGDEVSVGKRGLDPQAGQQPALRGKLVKVYPEIEGGRVLADVEVQGLGDFFVGERTLVWVPVGKRNVLSVPTNAVSTRAGVDYVKLANGTSVAVIVGETFIVGDVRLTEVLSGLAPSDKVVVP